MVRERKTRIWFKPEGKEVIESNAEDNRSLKEPHTNGSWDVTAKSQKRPWHKQRRFICTWGMTLLAPAGAPYLGCFFLTAWLDLDSESKLSWRPSGLLGMLTLVGNFCHSFTASFISLCTKYMTFPFWSYPWIDTSVISIACLVTQVWRRQWHPTPVLLPGKSHGQRSLVGCSPWGR